MLTVSSSFESISKIQSAKPIKIGQKVVQTKASIVAEIFESHLELADIFQFLLNPLVVTNVGRAKLNKILDYDSYDQIKTFSEYLVYLENVCQGRDEQIKFLQNYIYRQDPMYHDYLKNLATKNLKTGINATTYNKLAKINHLAPVYDFNVQLAQSIASVKKVKFENFCVTEKFDGCRCIAIVDNQKAELYTRNGLRISNVPEIEQSLVALQVGDFVFDGELLIRDFVGKAEDAFRETMSIVGSKHTKTNLVYHIFDGNLSKERFLTQSEDYPYLQRRNFLDEIAKTITNTQALSIAPVLYQGTNLHEAYLQATQVIDRGGEGVMVNNLDAPYYYKRTDNLLKIKQLNSNDGVILDVYEGTNRNVGRLGGVVITYKDTKVKIGSGFTDDERINYWQNPELILNHVATYEFTTESKNVDGVIDLRFGRWKGLRLDKTIKDVSYDN